MVWYCRCREPTRDNIREKALHFGRDDEHSCNSFNPRLQATFSSVACAKRVSSPVQRENTRKKLTILMVQILKTVGTELFSSKCIVEVETTQADG